MNFDLLILPQTNAYQVRVVNSPAGQAIGDFTLPFTQAELDLFAWRLGINYRHLRPATTTEEVKKSLAPHEFGTWLVQMQLCTCLFSAVRSRLSLRTLCV